MSRKRTGMRAVEESPENQRSHRHRLVLRLAESQAQDPRLITNTARTELPCQPSSMPSSGACLSHFVVEGKPGRLMQRTKLPHEQHAFMPSCQPSSVPSETLPGCRSLLAPWPPWWRENMKFYTAPPHRLAGNVWQAYAADGTFSRTQHALRLSCQPSSMPSKLVPVWSPLLAPWPT